MQMGAQSMLNGTFFWERLVSEEGIVSVRVLSQTAFWSILLATEIILFLAFGVLIGFIPVAIVFWAYTHSRRNGVKRAAASGSLSQLAYPRKIVKWEEITSAKIKKTRLEIVTTKHKEKFEFTKASKENLVSFLSSKLGPKLTVTK
jgi:hypothetical protein